MTQSIGQASAAAGRSALRAGAQIATQIATQQAVQAAGSLLFGPAKRVTSGRALDEIRLLTAGEGGGIPRVYGRGRVGGQIIWTSPVREETTTLSSTRGAKGVKASTSSQHTEFEYFVSIAIALCDGEISRLGRVWADGNLIALSDYDHRLYHGTQVQQPDTLIESWEDGAPAYQGLAYIVFEDLPLAAFGNRIPQFNFEIECPVSRDDPSTLENALRAVTIIPGSGEAVYATEGVFETLKPGVTKGLNQHSGVADADFVASLDGLQGTLPNTQAAALVVSWFADDLRAGQATLRPGVERRDRETEPEAWGVAGYNRTSARLLSETEGKPSYGGTPSDLSVRQAIRELKARGLAVMFHPFILMDIPSDNGLPDPYGAAEQAPFPWRGRITSDQQADDKTASARLQVDAFFDAFDPLVLHYAQLCAEEGGVEAFLLGSELRGLTRLRDEAGQFPAVDRLVALLGQVRTILPQAKLSYGADWSEYFGYQPQDEPGSVFYPLDVFWAQPAVDFVGIDNYVPLSDWRDAPGHLDEDVAEGPYDLEYLKAGIAGGEGFLWFYASDQDRIDQTRSPINDGAYGEDWVFRYKDLWSWWMNPHTERVGGVKTSGTPWVPQSKPFWFTELGCAAIDKGPNQPNVFVDPKSAESHLPLFSKGHRDDRGQRALLEAHHAFWSDPANNPVSSVDGQPMVRADRLFVYAWDARPYPAFPSRTDVWADAHNWVTGHWLNGRVGRVPLSLLIETIALQAGFAAVDASACDGLVSGLTLPEPETARQSLEPLFDLYQLDATARDGVLVVTPRAGSVSVNVDSDDLVDDGSDARFQLERVQDDELANAVSLTFQDELSDYAVKTSEVRNEAIETSRTYRMGTSVLLEQGEAEGLAAALLAEAVAMTTRVSFSLPELADGLEPSDVVLLTEGDQERRVRIVEMAEGPYRSFDTVTTDPAVFFASYSGLAADPSPGIVSHGRVLFEALDLPLLPDGHTTAHLWLAAFAEPWPGQVDVYRQGDDQLAFAVRVQSLMGQLTQPLPPGPVGRWDRASVLAVDLSAGGLPSRPVEDILNGAHLCAVKAGETWEVLQFSTAALQPDGTWHLGGLLRGRRGTEEETSLGADVGARFVLLSGASPKALPSDHWGTTPLFDVGPASAVPGAYPFASYQVALSGTGERPFAPVHLKAQSEVGMTTVTWIRRSRVGGDHWAAGDVLLGETVEAYEIRLLDGQGEVLETLESSAPSVSFSQPSAISLTVAQRSSAYGLGRRAQLDL